MDTLAIGCKGEDLAQEFLFKNGFELLHRNWRSGRYELDIVAVKLGVLHIVEVKTRKLRALTSPEDAMTRNKFKSLCRAAQFYISSFGIEMDVQFDLIAIDYTDEAVDLRYIPDVMSAIW